MSGTIGCCGVIGHRYPFVLNPELAQCTIFSLPVCVLWDIVLRLSLFSVNVQGLYTQDKILLHGG